MNAITNFISRWKISGGSEQANSQLFLTELCDALELPRPEPAKPINEENTYSFERKVYIPNGEGPDKLQRLDLYRKDCFVLESKQGQDKTAPPTLHGLTSSSAVKRGGALNTLQEARIAITADKVAEQFSRAPRARVQEILQALETLGFVALHKEGA